MRRDTFSPDKRIILARLLFAVIGGYCASLAMPRENLSPLIFLSVALLFISIRGLRFFAALGIGFIGGMVYYLSQIEWLSLYLGPVPWLALSTLEAIIFAIGMAVTSSVWNLLDKSISKNYAFRTLFIAIALAVTWTAREWVSITVPYGGFPWSRLAQTQSETFLGKWVYLGGLGLLTFVIALTAGLASIWYLDWRARKQLPHWSGLAVVGLVIFIPIVITPSAGAEAGSITIGAVQGNANAGLFTNEKRGKILENHLQATELLKHNELYKKLDVVVWPENASDLSPFTNSYARSEIKKLVDNDFKVPLIFGTITERGQNIYNSSILWKPRLGPTDWYDKKRPVPFAEYVPDRDFWYQLAPDLIGLVSRGYTFGERDGIFQLGNSKLGTLICFEIAVDDIGRGLVRDGAQIILSQTNNADFGHSDETYQQAAFARLRAIETGRVVVNVSTVGVSAIYSPNGAVIEQIPSFAPGVLMKELPLRRSITPAMVLGPVFDLMVNIIAVLLLLVLAYRSAWPPARRARI
jgi:apolipoprotein N-acyltransferase